MPASEEQDPQTELIAEKLGDAFGFFIRTGLTLPAGLGAGEALCDALNLTGAPRVGVDLATAIGGVVLGEKFHTYLRDRLDPPKSGQQGSNHVE